MFYMDALEGSHRQLPILLDTMLMTLVPLTKPITLAHQLD